MSDKLTPSIVTFFLARMGEHNRVASYRQIEADECLFELSRNDGLPNVTVHLSNAYEYTDGEYIARPSQIGRGDFVLIARPEAIWNDDVPMQIVETARGDGIGIGKIGKLMGALNFAEIWKFRTRGEREFRK